MALQLVACGNTPSGNTPSGSARQVHEAARPSRAAEEDSTLAPPSMPNDGVEGRREPAGPSAHTDGQPGQPVAATSDEPVVTPDTGWETVRCAGAGTRHVRIVGNLDAAAFVPPFAAPFDARHPAETSALGLTLRGFDDQGRAQNITVFFRPIEQGWDYYAVPDGTGFVIGEGHLSFDDQGAATAEVRQELRLLTSGGPGHAVALDLSGMTRLVDSSHFSELEVDGREARWGTACEVSESAPEATVAGSTCAAQATTRIALRANLAAATPVADALAPLDAFTLPFSANDAQGALIDFELALHKSSSDAWNYRVLTVGDVPGPEVANGSLSFNPNGSLRTVTATRKLRFPNHDGALGEPIELDFGASTAAGGNGVDGVTSFVGASVAISQQGDGAVLSCLEAGGFSFPTWPTPSCDGEQTTAVSMYFNLDPRTPLGDAVVYSTSTTIYDAALVPQELELQFQHVDTTHWQCRVSAGTAEVGLVDLHFTRDGAPQSVENIPLLRLPLADGSAGPGIQLGFDADWVITSFGADTYGWLTPNGAAPHTDGCVE